VGVGKGRYGSRITHTGGKQLSQQGEKVVSVYRKGKIIKTGRGGKSKEIPLGWREEVKGGIQIFSAP